MSELTAEEKNLEKENAELIYRVVMAVTSEEDIAGLERILAQAESNDWVSLVQAIRNILQGERDMSRLSGLDAEDQTIVSAILRGIENPATLPELSIVLDPNVSGPAIAGMIRDAAAGNQAAIDAIEALRGDRAEFAHAIQLMVSGERQEDILRLGLGSVGESLIRVILQELKKSGA